MTSTPDGLLYLDNAEVRALLDGLDVVGTVRDALLRHAAGEVLLPPEATMYWQPPGGGTARSLALPGGLVGETVDVGLKVINANPENPTAGLPRASGVLLLFDPTTARVRCIMQAEHVSSERTAAVSALAVAVFAPEARSLAVIGAGPLARAHVARCAGELPGLTELRIFDLDRQRAETLAAHAVTLVPPGVTITVAADHQAAVVGAEVVVPVTTTTTPYLEHDWLAPNALVVNVSLDDCTAEVVQRCGLLVVDDWALVAEDRRRLLGRLAADGQVVGPAASAVPPGARRVDGELGQLLRDGAPVTDGTVLVNPFGMGILDVALGTAVGVAARRTGCGAWLVA